MSTSINSRLKCLSSPHSLVFRRIDKILRADAKVKQVFQTVVSWQGEANDTIEPALDNMPLLRLTPSEGGDEWYGPGGFDCTLVITCELAVPGSNAEDAMDSVQVIRRALYPADFRAGLSIQDAIKAGGASMTGQPKFSRPGIVVATSDEGASMLCTFTIEVDVLLTLIG